MKRHITQDLSDLLSVNINSELVLWLKLNGSWIELLTVFLSVYRNMSLHFHHEKTRLRWFRHVERGNSEYISGRMLKLDCQAKGLEEEGEIYGCWDKVMKLVGVKDEDTGIGLDED